jgi:hypothetical protein
MCHPKEMSATGRTEVASDEIDDDSRGLPSACGVQIAFGEAVEEYLVLCQNSSAK